MLIKTEFNSIFLDTNVLIYQTFEDFDIGKHKYTNKVLSYLLENQYNIYISTQILKEYYSISTNDKIFKKPLNIEEALLKLEEFRNSFTVLYENSLVVDKLKDIILRYKIKKKNIFDANIISIMIINELEDIFTFNIKDFEIFKEIRIFKI